MIADISMDVERHLNAASTHRRSAEETKKMTPTKFLITGATGDTGGYTVRQLLEKNHPVRVLAHRPDERSEQMRKLGAEVVFGTSSISTRCVLRSAE
jgi:NADPH:quinone reductase-like Zn-dependent oxidoreductase